MGYPLSFLWEGIYSNKTNKWDSKINDTSFKSPVSKPGRKKNSVQFQKFFVSWSNMYFLGPYFTVGI